MRLGCGQDAVRMKLGGDRIPTQSCMICSKLHLWIAANLRLCGFKLTTSFQQCTYKIVLNHTM